jgi:hypothetical protein
VIPTLGYETGHLGLGEKDVIMAGKGTYVNSYSLQLEHTNLK